MDKFMELMSDPNIVIIDFLSTTKGKLRMAKEFFLKISYNINNGKGYSLIVTINPPSQSHYFCTIYEPFDGKIQQQG